MRRVLLYDPAVAEVPRCFICWGCAPPGDTTFMRRRINAIDVDSTSQQRRAHAPVFSQCIINVQLYQIISRQSRCVQK